MAGSAICRAFERAGYHQLLTASRSELDLSNSSEVEAWFAVHQPTVVVLAAAKVEVFKPTAIIRLIFCSRTSRFSLM